MSAENASDGRVMMKESTNISLQTTLAIEDSNEVMMKSIRIVGISSISLFSVSAYSC
jgi:hypothetical protein